MQDKYKQCFTCLHYKSGKVWDCLQQAVDGSVQTWPPACWEKNPEWFRRRILGQGTATRSSANYYKY